MSSPQDNAEFLEITSKMLSAIDHDDNDTLKHLLKLNIRECDKFQNEDGDNLLHLSILSEKYEIFDHVLSLDTFDLETTNKSGETALIVSLTYNNDNEYINEYFAIELVKKGANVHAVCNDKNTVLHLAMERHYLKVAELLIEKGADINAQNLAGCTPLHMIFHSKTNPSKVEQGIGLMMYYGADTSICDNNGNIPFELAVLYDPYMVTVQENLFYYTFDSQSDYKMSSEVLFELLQNRPLLFHQIMHNVAEVIFVDRVYFPPYLLFTIEPEVIKGLIEKFGYVVSEILLFGSSLDWHTFKPTSVENLNMLLQSHLASNMIEFIQSIKMDWLIMRLMDDQISKRTAMEFIFYLLTYGLNVCGQDVETVYKVFGYCELFKTLLHMDIKRGTMVDVVPRIIYDVQLDLGKFLKDPHPYSLNGIEQLLNYFAHPKLKRFCYELNVPQLAMIANRLPQVPLLVEIAREAVRKCLVKKFNIKSSKQFYTVLKWLPISGIHERIISYQTKIYGPWLMLDSVIQ